MYIEENSRLECKRGCGNGWEWGAKTNSKQEKKKSRRPDGPLDPLERKIGSWDL